MSQFKMVELSRPDMTALADAIAVCEGKSGEQPAEAMMAAGLVIVGEACAQLDVEKKPQDEVIASLVARGLSAGVAKIWVGKAHDVVNDTVNKDPERFMRERAGGIGKGEIAFYIVAILLAIVIWAN